MHHPDEVDHQEHAAVDEMMREEFGEPSESDVRAQAKQDIRTVRDALYHGQRSAAKYAAQDAFARLVTLLERGLLLTLVVVLSACGGAEFRAELQGGSNDAGAPADVMPQAGEAAVAGAGGPSPGAADTMR